MQINVHNRCTVALMLSTPKATIRATMMAHSLPGVITPRNLKTIRAITENIK